jgi:adenylate kinase
MTVSPLRVAAFVADAVGRPDTLNSESASHPTAPADDSFLPGPVLLIGPPGVGKGTQAKILMANFGIPQISTGDLFRQHRREHTELGLIADKLMELGQLVPDDLVNQMVAARLSEPDCSRGYILDGFPRTLAQAHWLDSYLASTNSMYPVVVISLVVDRDDLLKRIIGRRICPRGHIYNIYTQRPLVDGKCDIDGSQLGQRKDDTEEVFECRMKVFEEETAPVIPHYRAQGRFAEVNGLQDVDSVTSEIRSQLARLRTEPPAERS